MSSNVRAKRPKLLPCLAVMASVVLLCLVPDALAHCNEHRHNCKACLKSKSDCCYDLATSMCFDAEGEVLPRITEQRIGDRNENKKCTAAEREPLSMRATFFPLRNNCDDEVFVGPAQAVQRLLEKLYEKKDQKVIELCSALRQKHRLLSSVALLVQLVLPHLEVKNAEFSTRLAPSVDWSFPTIRISQPIPENTSPETCQDTAVLLQGEQGVSLEVLIGSDLLDQSKPPLFECVTKEEGTFAEFNLNLESLLRTGIVSHWCDKFVK